MKKNNVTAIIYNKLHFFEDTTTQGVIAEKRNIRATQSLQKNTHHLILKGCTTVFIPFIFLPSTAFSAARIRLSLTATKE